MTFVLMGGERDFEFPVAVCFDEKTAREQAQAWVNAHGEPCLIAASESLVDFRWMDSYEPNRKAVTA